MGFFSWLFGQDRKRETNEPRKEVTGYKMYEFDIRGMLYQKRTGDTWIDEIEEGDPIYLRNESENSHDPYAVQVWWQGRVIGYVERDKRLDICRANSDWRPLIDGYIYKKTVKEGSKLPTFTARIWKEDEKGCDPVVGGQKTKYYVVDGDESANLESGDYLLCTETMELMDRHVEWYSAPDVDEMVAQIEEDDCFLLRFIRDVNAGNISDENERAQFVRDATSTREFGTSKNLSRRINKWLNGHYNRMLD